MAHASRHTFATTLLGRTGGLRLVQAARNHASIVTHDDPIHLRSREAESGCRRTAAWLVDSRRYGVAATYDPVTREYAVEETMDARPYRRATTREFTEVTRKLTSGEHVLAFRVGEGKPERNLYVRIRARLDSGYLFSFIPVDAKTPWVNSRRFNLFGNEGTPATPTPR